MSALFRWLQPWQGAGELSLLPAPFLGGFWSPQYGFQKLVAVSCVLGAGVTLVLCWLVVQEKSCRKGTILNSMPPHGGSDWKSALRGKSCSLLQVPAWLCPMLDTESLYAKVTSLYFERISHSEIYA